MWNISHLCFAGWWFGAFFIFPYIGNNNPNWFSYFPEGFKPPVCILVDHSPSTWKSHTRREIQAARDGGFAALLGNGRVVRLGAWKKMGTIWVIKNLGKIEVSVRKSRFFHLQILGPWGDYIWTVTSLFAAAGMIVRLPGIIPKWHCFFKANTLRRVS